MISAAIIAKYKRDTGMTWRQKPWPPIERGKITYFKSIPEFLKWRKERDNGQTDI
jgi:hypothetical protein